MKHIVVAEEQGFCWGVRRALEIVNRYENVRILGDLIHNKQVVEQLEKAGKQVVQEVQGDESEPVVITAHGTTLEKIQQLKTYGLDLVDTTCPLVSAIYKAGEKFQREGYRILILGDLKHIEVQGIASRMENPIIINNEEELDTVELPEKLGIISQSTFSVKKFEKIVDKIKKRVENVKVRNTICAPTKKRQAAAAKLAQEVEVMIVVGGYHSSNTRKLAQLTGQYVDSYHVETADQVQEEWFTGKTKVGITAGASTADWTIQEVCERIRNFT